MADELDPNDINYLQSLVRMDLRRQEKKLIAGSKKWAPEEVESRGRPVRRKVRFAERVYRKLGGDPDNMTVAYEPLRFDEPEEAE